MKTKTILEKFRHAMRVCENLLPACSVKPGAFNVTFHDGKWKSSYGNCFCPLTAALLVYQPVVKLGETASLTKSCGKLFDWSDNAVTAFWQTYDMSIDVPGPVVTEGTQQAVEVARILRKGLEHNAS